MPPEPMIEVRELTKCFGTVDAVRGISFSVGRGEIVGFLGPNGAGKTTTMRMLAGIFPPTTGTVRIAGRDVLREPLACRRAVGTSRRTRRTTRTCGSRDISASSPA